MSAADPFKEIEELKARHERLQEQADGVWVELTEKTAALQARLDGIAPAVRKVSPMRKRGENLAAVKACLVEGLTDIKQIAERVNVTPSAVRMYLDKLKETDEGDDDEPAVKPTPPPPNPPGRPRGAPPSADGDTLDDVRAEVLKQGGKGRLMVTAGADGHKHIADVDRDGNGMTTAGGKDRHFHMVKDFVLRTNSGSGPSVHRHELTKQAADS